MFQLLVEYHVSTCLATYFFSTLGLGFSFKLFYFELLFYT